MFRSGISVALRRMLLLSGLVIGNDRGCGRRGRQGRRGDPRFATTIDSPDRRPAGAARPDRDRGADEVHAQRLHDRQLCAGGRQGSRCRGARCGRRPQAIAPGLRAERRRGNHCRVVPRSDRHEPSRSGLHATSWRGSTSTSVPTRPGPATTSGSLPSPAPASPASSPITRPCSSKTSPSPRRRGRSTWDGTTWEPRSRRG